MPNLSLHHRLPAMALAFRGYNITNLGRTGELLANRAFGPLVERQLQALSCAASDLLHRRVDFVAQVRAGEETTLETYGEALAFVLGVEDIQIELLREFFQVETHNARFAFGFSLGEV